MGLYDRIFDADHPNRIPSHGFYATMAEFARGKLTGPQAQTVLASISGAPLEGDEITQAAALLATITSQPTATAKLARAGEIHDVLMLSEQRPPGYDSAAAVQSKLGM